MTNQSNIDFYEKQIDTLKYMIGELETKGEEALHEIDKSKGFNYCKNKLEEDIKFFEDKLKGAKDEIQNNSN